MDKKKENKSLFFEPYEPVRYPILMFKISSLDRLQKMQNGLLYMNSLQYFSEIENEEKKYLRGDPLEKVYERLYAGDNGHFKFEFKLKIQTEKDEKIFDLGNEVVLTVEVPEPKNVMIFCMSAFVQDETGKIRGESDDQIKICKRLLEFGDHMLLIRNAPEFSNRISNAIKENPHIYGSTYFQGGYGVVEYIDTEKKSGHIGIFRKDKAYAWQNEFRFCFGVKDKGLNDKGAYELQIGDISDISSILPVQAALDEPFSVKRRYVKKVRDEYVEVPERA